MYPVHLYVLNPSMVVLWDGDWSSLREKGVKVEEILENSDLSASQIWLQIRPSSQIIIHFIFEQMKKMSKKSFVVFQDFSGQKGACYEFLEQRTNFTKSCLFNAEDTAMKDTTYRVYHPRRDPRGVTLAKFHHYARPSSTIPTPNHRFYEIIKPYPFHLYAS